MRAVSSENEYLEGQGVADDLLLQGVRITAKCLILLTIRVYFEMHIFVLKWPKIVVEKTPQFLLSQT